MPTNEERDALLAEAERQASLPMHERQQDVETSETESARMFERHDKLAAALRTALAENERLRARERKVAEAAWRHGWYHQYDGENDHEDHREAMSEGINAILYSLDAEDEKCAGTIDGVHQYDEDDPDEPDVCGACGKRSEEEKR